MDVTLARNLRDRIRDFTRRSEAEMYTDTDEVWILLPALEAALDDVTRAGMRPVADVNAAAVAAATVAAREWIDGDREDGLWRAVAAACPECPAGDYQGPAGDELSRRIVASITDAIEHWVSLNYAR